jgi:hypothetical protein
MLEDIKKELSHHNIILDGNYVITQDDKKYDINTAVKVFKNKAKKSYSIIEDLWMSVAQTLNSRQKRKTETLDGIEDIFVYSLTGLRRFIFFFPTLKNFDFINLSLRAAIDSDIDTFQYSTMSKIIEYKLAIEWLSHLINKNLYIKTLLVYSTWKSNLQVEAKGVFGPYSNLDLPMKERVFTWADIDEEVRGRSRDIRNQRRYSMGLEGYNDPLINEGWTWRELRNEPFLWKNQHENPYPHRNLLWK